MPYKNFTEQVNKFILTLKLLGKVQVSQEGDKDSFCELLLSSSA